MVCRMTHVEPISFNATTPFVQIYQIFLFLNIK